MIVGDFWTLWVHLIEFWKKNFRILDTIKYVEYIGKTRFSKYCRFLVPNRSWGLVNTRGHLIWTKIFFRIIVSEMRKFHFSKLYKTGPYGSNVTDDHSSCEENNQFETFSKCVSRLLAEFFFNLKIIIRIEFVSLRAFEPYQNHKNPPRETLSNIDNSC